MTDTYGKPVLIAAKVHRAMPVQSVDHETKLDKTEADIEKARKEAERRGLVVESKVYGAAIEIIDRLRDQLKQQDIMANEMKQLKAEVEKLQRAREC